MSKYLWISPYYIVSWSYKTYCLSKGSDNENEDKNDDDDRPECEYGLECYRKNPQHRKEYKHCRIERQAKRKAKEKVAKKKKAKNDDDEFDDSFIDDSEDDSEGDITNDEESVEEWTPGHSDDEWLWIYEGTFLKIKVR